MRAAGIAPSGRFARVPSCSIAATDGPTIQASPAWSRQRSRCTCPGAVQRDARRNGGARRAPARVAAAGLRRARSARAARHGVCADIGRAARARRTRHQPAAKAKSDGEVHRAHLTSRRGPSPAVYPQSVRTSRRRQQYARMHRPAYEAARALCAVRVRAEVVAAAEVAVGAGAAPM